MKKRILSIFLLLIVVTIVWIPLAAMAAQSPVNYYNSNGTVTTVHPDGSKTTVSTKDFKKGSSGKSTPSSSSSSGSFGNDNSSNSSGSSESSGDDESDDSSIWDLVDKINSLIKMLQDFVTGKLLYKALTGVVVTFSDETTATAYDLFEKSFLFMPRVAEIDFVYQSWSFMTYIGFGILVFGFGMIAVHIFKGRTPLQGVLKTYIICTLLMYASLSVVNIINVGFNLLTEVTLNGLTSSVQVDYKTIKGDNIIKAFALGSDALTTSTYKEQSIMQILSSEKGGVFTMLMFGLTVLLPLCIFVVLKIAASILLPILFPFYISWASLRGKMESVIGYLNITLRTYLAGFAMSSFWGHIIKMQTDTANKKGILFDMGISPTWYAIVLSVILAILLVLFWVIPLVHAVRDPIYLAGGKTLEAMGSLGSRMSNALGDIADRHGLKGLRNAADKWNSSAGKLAERGRRMQDERKRTTDNRGQKIGQLQKGAGKQSRKERAITSPIDWISGTETMEEEDRTPVGFGELGIFYPPKELAARMGAYGLKQRTRLKLSPEDFDVFQAMQKNLPDEMKSLIQATNADQQTITLEGDGRALSKLLKKEGITPLGGATVYTGQGVLVREDTGKVTSNGSPEALALMKEMKQNEDTYHRMHIPPEEAKAVLAAARKSGAAWAQHAIIQNDGLWVRAQDAKEAAVLLGKGSGNPTEVQRVDLPYGSNFMHQMLDDWKASGKHQELLDAIDVQGKDRLFVRGDQYEAFEKAYEDYRKGRQPYWTTKNGDVKVVQGQRAVNFGSQPPAKGLDMGSFETYGKRRPADPHGEDMEAVIRDDIPDAPLPVRAPRPAAQPNRSKQLPKLQSGWKSGAAKDQKRPAQAGSALTRKLRLKPQPSEAVPSGSPQRLRLPNRRVTPQPGTKRPTNVQSGLQRKLKPSAAPAKAGAPVAKTPGRRQATVSSGEAKRLEPRSSSGGKNANQKELAKQAARDGAKAGLKSAALASTASLLGGNGWKGAAKAGVTAGAKAGSKAAQKTAQKGAAKAVAKDGAAKLTPRNQRKPS